MENNKQADIKNDILTELILIYSECYYIFQRIGVGTEKGFQLIFDDVRVSNRFFRCLVDSGGVELSSLKGREPEILNFELGFHIYHKADRTEELQKFLCQKKFLAVVLVKAMPVEKLDDLAYPLHINFGEMLRVSNYKFVQNIIKIRKFIRSNPDVVSRELKIVKEKSNLEQADLEITLTAAAHIYIEFFRETHTDEEVFEEKGRVIKSIKYHIERALDCQEEIDSIDAIKKVLNRYFESNVEFEIASIDSIDDLVEDAIKNENAFIYDQQFYFVSERLFRKACGSLLDVMSLNLIKHVLQEENFLCCNRTENNNFTVKKNLINISGKAFRGRFLKFRKSLFIGKDELSLEERRKDNGRKKCFYDINGFAVSGREKISK